MKFSIKESYNFDLLNYINVITGDDFYTKYHMDAWLKFRDTLSDEAKNIIKEIIKINEGPSLGPVLSLVMSSVPDFNTRSLLEMLADANMIKEYFSKSVYFSEDVWSAVKKMLDLIEPVIKELEDGGFYSYWVGERLPVIRESAGKLEEYVLEYDLQDGIENMLGNKSMDEITLYLCSFAAPHGMKVIGNNYISDVTFAMDFTLLVAVHEMFHPPYDSKNIKEELKRIAEEPFFKNAFDTKDPMFGYTHMDGFIEENVVEAMSLFVCDKLGLVKNSIEYLLKHDKGSHVFSVILMKYFKLYEKPREQSFEEYFMDLVKVLPFGRFREEYEEIINSGIAKGDS